VELPRGDLRRLIWCQGAATGERKNDPFLNQHEKDLTVPARTAVAWVGASCTLYSTPELRLEVAVETTVVGNDLNIALFQQVQCPKT
jgi:hypothetical protein